MSSVWLDPDGSVRLHAWSSAELAAIREAFDAICSGWAADWGVPHQAVVVGGTREVAVDDESWRACGRAGGGVWLRRLPSERLSHELALVGTALTPVTSEVVLAMRRDLEDRVLGAFGVARAGANAVSIPRRVLAEWSGGLLLAVGEAAELVADVAALRQLAGLAPPSAPRRASPVTSVDAALAHVALHFDLELAGCEVAAEALLSLQSGDVVCLSHPLHQPVRVVDGHGLDCFFAELRSRHGRRAAQLCGVPPARERDQQERNHGA
jgi:hypothetical protein